MSLVLKGREPIVAGRMERAGVDALSVSIVSRFEMLYGAVSSSAPDRNSTWVLRFLSAFQCLHFNHSDALHAVDICAALRQVGTPIGPYDTLIAGQARARGLTLVSRNLKEFGRVPGLLLQDWR